MAGLLSSGDEQKLRELFAKMSSPVRLVFFTQTLGCETCLETRQIIDELPPLSDLITVEEVNLILDRDKATQFAIDRAPAIAVVGVDSSGAERDSKIRFLGAPAGYEFMSLIHAILLVGGGQSPSAALSEESRRRIAAVDKPVTMQVFTTPT